uniref:RE1-silencing transcription factor n=1 Tax=Magallana gigas TaxID=29159 RepID=K1R039_MAGGI
MHPPSPKENSFGKLERINSRNIFEDLLVESSTSGEEVQHQTCPINEDSKKVNDKSISQQSVLSLKKVCTLGARQCSKESNQKFKNTKDNTNLSEEDLPSDVVNKHDDLIHVTNETDNPVLVTNEEGTTEAIDKEVEKEDRTNEEIGSKEKEKEGVIKVTDSQEKMEDGTTMETDNQERKEGETLDSTNNLEGREEGTSENSNDLEEEKEGSKEETESQVRMLDEASSETMNQVGKENGSTKERDKQEVKEEEMVEKQNSKEEKEKEFSKDTTNKIVETSKILSASEETSNETPKNSSKQVNSDNTEVDLEKQDKLPEDTDNEDKRNQSDTIENETTHSVGDKIKLLEQIEDKTTKPESQNDTVDLDCEESENLVIDIQENSYESNVENSVGKKNVDLSSAETKEDKSNQLGKLIEESKEQKLPEAVDIQENTDSINGENLVRNSNDVNTDAVKQKEPERKDNQSDFEDGVEEIQTLLQEFVNSSSKPVVISDNSKASLAGTESQIDSSQKGSTTEAAWSTVGLDRCSYCLFTTDQKELLETHMSSCSRKNTKKEEICLVYSSNNKYGCKNCLFMSAQKKKFEEHVAFHILADPYICLTCMVTYDSKKEIEKHVKQVHSNKVVKCGLRGSKKINKIIEELHSKKEVTFIGRKVEKKALLPMIDQKEKPAQNFSITTVGSEGSLPVTVEAYNSKIAKNRQYKFGQDNGSQITTKPNTTTILSVPSIPKFTQSVSSIQPKTFSARANAPIFSLAGSVSSSSMPVIASSVHQAVLAQPLTFPGQAAVRGPVLCTVSSQSQPMILVPVQQIQTRGVLAGPFQIKSGQAGSQILPVSKSQFVNISPAPPKPISATAGTQAQRVIVVNTGSSLTTSTAQINSNNQLSQTRNTIPTTVNMIGMQPISLKLKQQVDSSAGDANGKSAIIKLTVNHAAEAEKKQKTPLESKNTIPEQIVLSSDEEEDVSKQQPASAIPKRKQVAMKSTSGAKSIKQSHSYFLGGDILHKKLQPCFTKEEDEPMFQCVMCKDVFEDKYSLHKHILDHMDVSFYKCSYCENGELEISSMVSHIQKMHRKPIKHTRVSMEIIEDDINRAIHALKAKQHWGEPDSSLLDIKPNVLDQKAFSPYVEQNINSPSVLTNIQSSIILNQPKLTSTPEKNKLPECVIPFGSSYKCIVCNQQAIQSYILVRHAMTHCSLKRFVCPYCDKRSHYKSDVCKHIHMKHKGNKVFVAYDKTNLEEDAQYIAPPIKEQILNAPDNDLQNKSTIRDDVEENVDDVIVKKEPETDTQLNASLGKNQTSSSGRIVPSRKMKKEGHESDEDEEEEKDDEEEEPEEEEESEEEDGEPRGDLKNMFSPCHNYKVEFDDRRQKTIYKCSICPYQSTVNKTMVTHFYHHVPHVFKCPYCDFQGYPRTHSSKSKQKPKKNMPIMARETRCLNESRATVFRKRKRDQEGTEASKETGKLVYSCNYCNHKANGLYHYRQHLASHNGFKHLVPGTQIESRLKCGYCSYLAVDDDDFKSHMEYHFATRPFSCPYCNFSQYRASGITNHIKRSHPGKTVDVVKESDSSCHIGHEFDAKAMIVDFEPNVKLTDIFAMDPEDFEKLLNKCEVCVIDLNYIPDEKFDAVSKTLGLENEERNVDDELEPNAKKVKRENVCEDKQQLDESEDLETMIANGELKIEENQKYDDVSDDDLD